MIFMLVGKSGTGKDTIRSKLLENKELKLSPLVYCTTRDKRPGEVEGDTYYFKTDEEFKNELERGLVVEYRVYHTASGDKLYYTIDNVSRDKNYICQGSLDMYEKYLDYFGFNILIPIYIDVDIEILLDRKIQREKNGSKQYYEMCRRIYADSVEFPDDLVQLYFGNKKIVHNNSNIESCYKEIEEYIKQKLGA